MSLDFVARDSLSTLSANLAQLASENLSPTLTKLGLTQTQFDILSTIRAMGNSPTQVMVAKELGITPPSLSESLKILVEQGWLLQELSPVDKRAKVLRLSPKGNQAFRQILKQMSEIEASLVEGIDPEDLKIALQVLRSANLRLMQS